MVLRVNLHNNGRFVNGCPERTSVNLYRPRERETTTYDEFNTFVALDPYIHDTQKDISRQIVAEMQWTHTGRPSKTKKQIFKM